ncbi:MAG TPA: hypothetical protein PKW06_11740 [Cyclobacteriaceae bacterium]|nr:hypothetical protein [Cyclobacteriaceae bacterium]MCB9239374.1 hypothetical protein [Flammeovirgaceae bacterium]MCB0499701.1 hypothetical protein [Cyclobacteriaceae bacterium]MCO5271243.1 hypothetical protein [Cyclobacteriaceae bacterium]MCW5902551.1 hypothetical protein [Cyclobacteriaceae bacterium]
MQSLIHTPTSRLEDSLGFYKKLEFKVLSCDEGTFVTDGKAVILINPDRFARAGVKLYKNDWAKEMPKLKKLTAVHKTKNGFLLSDASGVWIYLEEGGLKLGHEPAREPFSVLGNYAGLSLESLDIERSVEVWKTLGFETTGSPGQGWAACKSEDGLTVNIMNPLMCPHLFFNPSMTYFNGKENNPKVIAKIRALGIPIVEGITHFNDRGIVDNVIIRDPGGYGFFIFND